MTVDINLIHSIDNLIAWIKTKPADETYCYTLPRDCPLFHYFSDSRLEIINVSPYHYIMNNEKKTCVSLPFGFNKIFNVRPWTYGDALKRAEKIGNRSIVSRFLSWITFK